MPLRRCALVALLLAFSATAGAQQAQVSFENGLLTVSCRNAPLSSVFEKIEEAAGVELILEDAVKTKRLTASFDSVPVAMAVQRLLDGGGVNYAVMMDPRDWGRVDKVFVGAGGGGPARSAAPPRRPPPPELVDDEYDDFEDFDDADMENMGGDLVDDPDADFDDMDPSDDPGQEFAPPRSSPVPSYLPPQQSFPRSNFTPGLPGGASQQPQGASQPQPGQPALPPATMPFMDALGRPIPVPPDMNQQRRQQQQQ
jgi:hypothetical protein